MQGKEASEQETKVKSNVGIDTSKCWLDVHILPSGERRRLANSEAGVRQLKRWLLRHELALVVIEATGKWHRLVHRSLVASAIPVAVVDPFRVRMFAKAQGILAKTDRLDARVLAAFAAVMAPPLRPPAPKTMAELAELVVARASAVEAQTALKNQCGAAEGSFLKRQLERRIVRAGSPALAELGSLTTKQIAMLAGSPRSPTNRVSATVSASPLPPSRVALRRTSRGGG